MWRNHSELVIFHLLLHDVISNSDNQSSLCCHYAQISPLRWGNVALLHWRITPSARRAEASRRAEAIAITRVRHWLFLAGHIITAITLTTPHREIRRRNELLLRKS